jgi:hypothetical protein
MGEKMAPPVKRIQARVFAVQLACAMIACGGGGKDDPDRENEGTVDAGRLTRDSGLDVVVMPMRDSGNSSADSESPISGRNADVDSGAPSAGAITPVLKDAGSDGTGGKLKPAFVAVGYSGLRIVSFDLGVTWVNEATIRGGSGDDPTLIRAIDFANGLFVAVGHKIWTSADGATWMERTNPSTQWLGGVKYGNGRWVAAGGWGASIYSTDGIKWELGGDRSNEPARSLAFGGGVFVAGADSDKAHWWKTVDGRTWTLEPIYDQLVFTAGTLLSCAAGPA